MSSMRYYVRNQFSIIFENSTSDPIPTNLEKAIFNWTIRQGRKSKQIPTWKSQIFRENYKRKFLSIQFNLKHPQNDLKKRIINEEIEIQVPDFNPVELFPTGIYAETELLIKSKEMEQEAKKKHTEDTKIGIFTCGKCKSQNTTYYEMQTRSADEPMTAFITCLKCGKRWKQ